MINKTTATTTTSNTCNRCGNVFYHDLYRYNNKTYCSNCCIIILCDELKHLRSQDIVTRFEKESAFWPGKKVIAALSWVDDVPKGTAGVCEDVDIMHNEDYDEYSVVYHILWETGQRGWVYKKEIEEAPDD